MRALVLALALVPLAAAAQPTVPNLEPGVYGSVGLSGGYGGSNVGALGAAEGAVGYRLPSGLGLGVYVAGGTASGQSVVAFGPEVTFSRALDARTTLDLHGNGTVALYRGPALEAAGFQSTGVGARLEGSVTRRFDLGRGVRLATTGGIFGGVTRSLGLEAASGPALEGGLGAHAGVVAGVQLEFEALGARFAVGPVLAVPVVGVGARDGFGMSGYRAGGSRRGFLTATF